VNSPAVAVQFCRHSLFLLSKADALVTKVQWISGVSWVLQVAVAAILLQTLFFKFTGAEESKYIFSKVGAEPWGRIGSGVVELIAAALLLYPGLAAWGALLAAGVMVGAIGSHLFILGVVVKDDGGLLFGLAVLVFVGSVGVLVLRRGQLPFIAKALSTVGLPVV
jgi:putative oxidoreductase